MFSFLDRMEEEYEHDLTHSNDQPQHQRRNNGVHGSDVPPPSLEKPHEHPGPFEPPDDTP